MRHSLGAHTLRSVAPEAWVLLARGLIFFLSIAWIFLSWNEFVGSEAPVPRAPLPKFSCPQLPPSCPHRTVAAEVRKQVSRERSGSPHSSRRCSSSLGVSVWEPPPPAAAVGTLRLGGTQLWQGRGSLSWPSTVPIPVPSEREWEGGGPPSLQGAALWVVGVVGEKFSLLWPATPAAWTTQLGRVGRAVWGMGGASGCSGEGWGSLAPGPEELSLSLLQSTNLSFHHEFPAPPGTGCDFLPGKRVRAGQLGWGWSG